MNSKLTYGIVAGLLMMLAMPLQAQFISLGGLLQDSQGEPLQIDGSFAMRVVYYESETAPDMILEVNTVASVGKGIFSATVAYPSELSAYSEIWYEMAIDTDSDGIDSDDFFANRFHIASVPTSLSGTIYNTYQTHGGIATIGSLTGFTNNDVHVSLIESPPSAVNFNHVAMLIVGQNAICNAGIYDSEGNLLFETGSFSTGIAQPPFVIPMEGTLLPSRRYFVAFVSTGVGGNGSNVYSYPGIGALWPYQPLGHNLPVATNAELPQSFVPEDIGMSTAMNLALLQIEESSRRSSVSPQIMGEHGIPILMPVGYESTMTEEEIQQHVDQANAAIRELIETEE